MFRDYLTNVSAKTKALQPLSSKTAKASFRVPIGEPTARLKP